MEQLCKKERRRYEHCSDICDEAVHMLDDQMICEEITFIVGEV